MEQNSPPKRKSVSKKTRFEVLKRDRFSCQYCGASGADEGVVLVIDHIIPVSLGGDNSIINLITACQNCNSGKGATELSDNLAINKQKKQLDLLQEKREQIELMAKWKQELTKTRDFEVSKLADHWAKLVSPYSLNNSGLSSLKQLLRRFGFDEIWESIDISTSYYLKFEADEPKQESVEISFQKIGGICFNRRKKGE